ncbi:MAG: 23S rRNA (pseudouridine(1915)-N(3))-methyltransferase RlmH [Gammaproteobacteria bacterium]|jgi:23S rRNA (pseudouridine1915-N3)-methyltransferase|nr:23S rRNA (pseudouridine(1915)-N(3))-methyltransferase RlmH [Gammaproteobacteria bacterium]
MKINLIAIGNKMPCWVDDASQDFIKRLPPEIKINSILLPLIKRGKNPDIPRIVRDESRKLLAAVPRDSLLVVLDVLGRPVTTMKLASMLESWLQQAQDVSIIIGGPDGVSDELLSKSSIKLSLSALTFPHPLVRVILLEQIYRAWSILNNHPYHRA